MSTWIFQGNPTKFNVDDYLLENENIWWSIRQQHLAEHIKLGDEVFIWRSDGGSKGSGGIVAKTKVITLPQDYTNDNASAEYWYEDVSNDTYLAVGLKVLEVEILNGINRLELKENENLADLKILHLKQNTNYLLSEEHGSYLRQLWFSRVPVNPVDIQTRFPLVETIEHVKDNMKQFEGDLEDIKKLEQQLPSFQQWYYIHEEDLLAPSKFIGYKNMKGHQYVNKDAIAGTDGRVTERVLKQWFELSENELLRKHIQMKLNGRTRKDFSINILKSERKIIEETFSQLKLETGERQLINELHKSMLNIYEESKAIGYTPTKFKQMVANEGGLQTAKRLINSKQLSDGFAALAEKNRLDLTVEALVLQKKYGQLFTAEELLIASERLKQFDYSVKGFSYDGIYELPPLIPSGREREYKEYSDEIKSQVIYEHIINNQTHRWMDVNVLEENGNTNGRKSANILYYLGMKADYRGIFEGKELSEVIQILEDKGVDYSEVVRLLKLLDDTELEKSIDSDIEAEKVEEGHGIEGNVKYYYGKRYERDSKNRKLAIKKHGLNCYACGFNFEEVYGERGKDFIEVHHLKPLSALEEAIKINPETDLVPLCANCHRMVHRRKDDILSIEELKEIVNEMK